MTSKTFIYSRIYENISNPSQPRNTTQPHRHPLRHQESTLSTLCIHITGPIDSTNISPSLPPVRHGASEVSSSRLPPNLAGVHFPKQEGICLQSYINSLMSGPSASFPNVRATKDGAVGQVRICMNQKHKRSKKRRHYGPEITGRHEGRRLLLNNRKMEDSLVGRALR